MKFRLTVKYLVLLVALVVQLSGSVVLTVPAKAQQVVQIEISKEGQHIDLSIPYFTMGAKEVPGAIYQWTISQRQQDIFAGSSNYRFYAVQPQSIGIVPGAVLITLHVLVEGNVVDKAKVTVYFDAKPSTIAVIEVPKDGQHIDPGIPYFTMGAKEVPGAVYQWTIYQYEVQLFTGSSDHRFYVVQPQSIGIVSGKATILLRVLVNGAIVDTTTVTVYFDTSRRR